MKTKIFVFLVIVAFCLSCDRPDRGNDCDPGSSSYNRKAPGNFSASDGEHNDYVEAKWTEIADADKYYIFRKEGSQNWIKIGESKESVFHDTAAINRVQYEYCVTALFSDKSNSDFSLPDGGFCDMRPPAKIAASDGTYPSSVQLSWEPVERAVSYAVQKREIDGEWKKLTDSAECSFNDTLVSNNVMYEYRVAAIFGNGQTGDLSLADTGYCAMPVPQIGCSRGSSVDTISVSWDVCGDADAFTVLRASAEDGNYYKLCDTTEYVYSDTAITKGIRYWYKVIAKKGDYVQSLSLPVWGCTKLAPPSNVTATRGIGDSEITISFSPVTNATRYRVYRLNDDASYLYCGESLTNSYTDSAEISELGNYISYSVSALTTDEESESIKSAVATGLALDQMVENGNSLVLNIIFNRIPSTNKQFLMGDSSIAPEAHYVTFKNDLWVSRAEMTVQQVKSLINRSFSENDYRFSKSFIDQISSCTDDLPAAYMSWFDAVLLCNLITEISYSDDSECCYLENGGTVFKKYPETSFTELEFKYEKLGYRLMTEAEWEFACKGGSTTAYYWGDADGDAVLYARYVSNSSSCSSPVMSYLPNNYGLYDMCGNVDEWCTDTYYDKYTSNSVYNDKAYVFMHSPISEYVLRGGSFNSSVSALQSVYRVNKDASGRSMTGVRLCRLIKANN
ncbi:MAG: SUMF1/EgtB/PvdO family nonheme iron enzyme [Candidatus Latescibacteria bacterium]|nr:SUMF1/EgtB/PvdO family nonheme iron enzyme [Candidatus Latescibacterota bacterium]